MNIKYLQNELKTIVDDGLAAVCMALITRIPDLIARRDFYWNDAFPFRATMGLYRGNVELVISFDVWGEGASGMRVSGDIMLEQGPILKHIIDLTVAESSHAEADILEHARFFVRECQALVDYLERGLL